MSRPESRIEDGARVVWDVGLGWRVPATVVGWDDMFGCYKIKLDQGGKTGPAAVHEVERAEEV